MSAALIQFPHERKARPAFFRSKDRHLLLVGTKLARSLKPQTTATGQLLCIAANVSRSRIATLGSYIGLPINPQLPGVVYSRAG